MFEVESSGVAARDARVKPEHDGIDVGSRVNGYARWYKLAICTALL